MKKSLKILYATINFNLLLFLKQLAEEKIESDLLMLIDDKEKLNELLNESMRKFPENQKINDLKRKFDGIFSNDINDNG